MISRIAPRARGCTTETAVFGCFASNALCTRSIRLEQMRRHLAGSAACGSAIGACLARLITRIARFTAEEKPILRATRTRVCGNAIEAACGTDSAFAIGAQIVSLIASRAFAATALSAVLRRRSTRAVTTSPVAHDELRRRLARETRVSRRTGLARLKTGGAD